MLTMPTAYGAEFRPDVIDAARKGEAPLAQIAKDFGLSVTTLKRWIAIAERKESGAGPASGDSAEMRDPGPQHFFGRRLPRRST